MKASIVLTALFAFVAVAMPAPQFSGDPGKDAPGSDAPGAPKAPEETPQPEADCDNHCKNYKFLTTNWAMCVGKCFKQNSDKKKHHN
ncbi:hypothetical protein PT974_01483 [Cladobotryum mycophilum]|uniref:Uncharacterized protein n=1 Tax=Cladobotryum mycophilum TaxID=491253 RepID=A0ABR0T4Z0_9HYPO